MKLISLWEPWATLMAIGAKKVETRSWSTPYRGWLAIQAAKHFTADEDDQCWMSPFREVLQSGGITDLPYRSGRRFQFPLGQIIAIVRLQTCWPTHHIKQAFPGILTEQERAFGDYSDGRYGWITSDLFRLPDPIPFKAKQGLVEVPDEVVMELRRQWRKREPLDRADGVVKSGEIR